VGDDDALAWVAVSSGSDDIILATAQGRLARFHEREVRPMGRDAAGVIGIRLARQGDQVVGMSVIKPGMDILVLTETGYKGGVCIEVEDRAYEGDLELRKASLIQSGRYLKNFIP
jgi:DNA gyrase/topoisomerase IV subunit A